VVSAPHEICGTVCGVFSLLHEVTHSVGKILYKESMSKMCLGLYQCWLVFWTPPMLYLVDTWFVYLNHWVIKKERQWEEPSHIFIHGHKIETLLETQQCKKLKCLVVTTLAMA